ncbi:hypothetical protein XHC_3164 [Xanthomonas hortorum pv. carotae str. M081]|nr:hypothetical protein XHC_3164 [Xanthomonas hortorum pv. carotae str. M081]
MCSVYRWCVRGPSMAQLNVPVMSLTLLGFFATAALSPWAQLGHNPATHF